VYLLGIHNSAHDAAACLFRDYQLLAAVSLERLTRKKGAGVCAEQELPIPAIANVWPLPASGAPMSTWSAPRATISNFSPMRYGTAAAEAAGLSAVAPETFAAHDLYDAKLGVSDALDIFDTDSFRARYGFDKADIYFANHHFAHGIAAYFYSPFDDSLVYTADACGDNVAYSARAAGQACLRGCSVVTKVFTPCFRPTAWGISTAFSPRRSVSRWIVTRGS